MKRIAIVLLVLLLVLSLAAVLVVQTQWFQTRVRESIIAFTENATGGKVELGSFEFHWTGMRASVSDFVLHGSEGPGQAPLLRARRAGLVLKLFPGFRHAYELDSLDVDTPQVHVIVYPDGHTNVPSPKVKTKSNSTVLEDVVDLAVHRFSIRNGTLDFNDQKIDFNASGRNLVTQLSFDTANQTYDGQIAMNPLMVQGTPLAVLLPVHLERDKIQLTQARITSPQSDISGSGSLAHLKDPQIAAEVHARIALTDVNRIAGLKLNLRGRNVPQQLIANLIVANNRLKNGDVTLGNSAMQAQGARVEAKLALPQLGALLNQPALASAGMAQLSSNVEVAKDAVKASDLHAEVLGGSFTGSASLEQMRRYLVAGDLRGFDLQKLAQVFTSQSIGYAGTISGPVEASGDLNGKRGVLAQANLSIQPGRNGVPVSGKLNVDSKGDVGASFVALPSTRVDLSGSLYKQVHVKLVSHNLADFQPLLGSQPLPAKLTANGEITFEGDVTSAPRIAGHLAAHRFVFDDRPFDQLSADLVASSSSVAIANGTLSRGVLEAGFTADVGLDHWKTKPAEPLQLTAQIRNADLADVMALAGERDNRITGSLNATANIGGTLGNPQGSAALSVGSGTLYGYRFTRLTANVGLTDQLVTLTGSQLAAGTAQVHLTGTYRHPQDSFSTGHFDAKITSNAMPLDQFRAVDATTQPLAGMAQINGALSGDVLASGVKLTSINGNADAHGVHYQGETLGDLQAAAKTSGSTADFQIHGSPFGSTISASGQTQLTKDYPTAAAVTVTNLPLERAASLAGRRDLQLVGNLNAQAKLSGTLANPSGTATFNIKNATFHEHADTLQGQLVYANNELRLPSLRVTAGKSELDISGSFIHPENNFQEGQWQFTVKSNNLQLALLKTVQELEPGLEGTIQVEATGAGRLQKGQPLLLLTSLNGNAGASGISLNRQPMGDATLSAETHGQALDFKVRSNFVHADIQADGQTQLSGDYETKAGLTFKNVTYAGLRAWLPMSDRLTLRRAQIDGVMEGSGSLQGPLLKPEELTASLQIPKLELAATPRASLGNKMSKMTLQNEGPIALSLSRSIVRVDSAHIIGPHTDLRLSGTATLQPKQTLNLQADGTLDLGVLQSFDRDLYSSGSIALNAKINGTVQNPAVTGQLRLKSASINMIDAPNGISNANGTVVFTGKSAVIQSLTAESGGGSISVAGNASYAAENLNFRLTANAKNVRVRYPESVSTLADAALIFSGNLDRSALSGTVTVQRIGFNPHSDFGSILSRAAPPIQAPAAPNPLLAGVQLQIQVRTIPGVQLQTALAQNIQATADLRVRGTLDEPDVLGRINITQGELIFFGTKYTVNQGTISFYDPAKIVPVLNVDLETSVQGVDIILTVSGPADNLTLTHRSDPPLPFEQVLTLLAAGKTPTDPTIAARQTEVSPQSVQQLGESALLSQVVATPISDRLSRVFGITDLRIAPAFVTGSVLPQARVTLTQQVARNVSFTYITDVTNSNTQIFQVEWSISDKWSAVATRDENGLFGIDFYYKRKFK